MINKYRVSRARQKTSCSLKWLKESFENKACNFLKSRSLLIANDCFKKVHNAVIGVLLQPLSIVVAALILLSSTDIHAQRKLGYELRHKNGSIVRGIIKYQNQDTICMITKGHDKFIFARKDILDIKIWNIRVKPCKKFRTDTFATGIYNYNTIGLLIGNSEVLNNANFSFNTSFGYEFNHWIGLGLGVGVDNLRTEILPISFGVKSHIFNLPYAPFVHLSFGYSIPLSKTKVIDNYREYGYEGGFHYGFDIGMAAFKSNYYAFTITGGYKYQRIKEISHLNYYYNPDYKEITTYDFHKIAVRIGFMFRLHKKYKSDFDY